MELEELRKQIDGIDDGILELFLRRMECAKQVAEVKRQKDLPIFNEAREQKILDDISRKAGESGGQARILYANLMAMSREVQHRALGSGDSLRRSVGNAFHPTEKPRIVACLGQKGSYSHEAAARLFYEAEPVFFSDFPSIFASVDRGTASLGVLPVENSTAGSVNEVYDLILKYRFSIVAAVSLPVRHCLASRETESGRVRVAYSHPQALRQCAGYLQEHGIPGRECSSTAEAAARAVRESGAAAICSEHAAADFRLNLLERNIQDSDGNRTRFIAIGRSLLIPPKADKISLCFAVPHRIGTLCSVLARFAAAGLNLTKIESRPIPGRNFEYDFYLDFSGSAADAKTLDLLCALSEELPRFSFLGNYVETE
ncbi:bifunctional chorismate mutase/prephenate dehydratase [Caproiciproducens sp. NJN-50]|uniref:bifunctional chorismate mutase/prephenate dehydratase n=1 Tax=Acutalibacteraceae TaxID=3082771 RepID=UPI000FFE1A05|nr:MULTISPECIES: bifunctional chorismate mutase/prephenate dehydratase [Acutalibacteraceae]QAT50864.1 bifunctional chorismate mutase/prephenate dehydratase [Caproiciproducens sp. NJN-50]